MFKGAGADPDLRGEVLQETIGSQPVVAHGLRPALPMEALPLRSEVPAKRNWSGPEDTVDNKLSILIYSQ